MVASFVDASTLLCTSPSAEVAGAAVSTSLDFSSAPTNLTLYSHPPGVARVADGVLWLTDVEFEQTGTAILPLPGASIMGVFFASFDLYADLPNRCGSGNHASEDFGFMILSAIVVSLRVYRQQLQLLSLIHISEPTRPY